MPSMPGWIKKYKEIPEAFGNSFSITLILNYVTRNQPKG